MRVLASHTGTAAAMVFALSSSTIAYGQAPIAPGDSSQRPGATLRLTVDEAVQIALKQNLGLQAERFNPRIQDFATAQTRASWAPTLTSSALTNSTATPITSIFSGGDNRVTDSRFGTTLRVRQTLPTGGNYAFAWNGGRSRSTNFFSTYDPLLNANLSFEVTQPLLRNLSID